MGYLNVNFFHTFEVKQTLKLNQEKGVRQVAKYNESKFLNNVSYSQSQLFTLIFSYTGGNLNGYRVRQAIS